LSSEQTRSPPEKGLTKISWYGIPPHRQIYEVMRTRDPEAVKEAMRTHNMAAYNAYQAYLDEKVSNRTEPLLSKV
jgi:DNA-binding FadR family transcriptional regulator